MLISLNKLLRYGVVDTLKINQPFTLIGIILIIAGLLFLLLPIIAQHIPNIQKIPWILLWTYKTDNFLFATSPILIIITIISLILNYLKYIK